MKTGDSVQVTDRDSKFFGCILTLLGMDGKRFICRNDSCGTCLHQDETGKWHNAIIVSDVRTYTPERSSYGQVR